MPDNLNEKLQNTINDVDRILKNRGALCDVMSDMIFLIREDYHIEDMNKSAIDTFGDLRGKICHKGLHNADRPCEICPVQLTAQGQRHDQLIEKKIGDVYVEFSYVPFTGYKGDNLVMIVKRDITTRKRHELEITEFNTNIESILHQKISELKESEKIRTKLSKEVNVLKNELDKIYKADEMVGSNKKIHELRQIIYQVADSNATILITGASGTGKELVADLVYKNSSRHDKPYLKFNCAAVSESLLESDLFGYEKGAFTGAASKRKGKFEIASGGTIFLDEIGDISTRMQVALLRVLQNNELIRVGGTEPIKVDVRIIAATNKDLGKAVEEGVFRRDLYYRLNVVNLRLPSLAERKDDILLLTSHFIKKYRAAFKKDIDFLPTRTTDRLLMHDWPGNIRELENVIQRAVLMAKNNIITENELEFDTNFSSYPVGKTLTDIDNKLLEQPLKDSLAEFEQKIISAVIEKCDGKIQQAATVLGVGKTAIYDKIKRYGLCKEK